MRISDWSSDVCSSDLIGTTAEVFYASAYDAAANYDPAGRQAKYALLNMRVGVGPENGSWELAFVGRNLTDKQVFQFVGDTAIEIGRAWCGDRVCPYVLITV